MTRFFTVSTAGHVDHGKTSLLRALTGIDPDRLKEEKERQMTTDLGFAHAKLSPDIVVGFVDVPGHGKFLKNMLAGVGGIDMALLVVAADEGPMPQTEQHVRILSLLGVSQVVVALNKIDAVKDDEHIALVSAKIEKLLEAHGMQMRQLVPVSASKNIGIDELKRALLGSLEQFERAALSQRAFLPVDRVFVKAGFGTVITGTLVRGQLKVGAQINIEPEVTNGRVRRLESFGNTVDVAGPGQRVACNVVIKDNIKLVRGNVITTGTSTHTKNLIATIIDEPALSGEKFRQVVEDHPIRLYHGTAEVHGRVRWAKESPETERRRLLAYLSLEQSIVALPEDRFVLRMSDDTIYGGVVLLRDKPRWIKREDLLAIGQALQRGDFSSACLHFVSAARNQIVNIDWLLVMMEPSALKKTLSDLSSAGKIRQLGDSVMTKDTSASLDAKLRCVLKELLSKDRNVESVGGEFIRSKLVPKLSRTAFQQLIDDAVSAGDVVRKGDQLTFKTMNSAPAAATTTALEQRVLELVNEHFCLDLNEIAKAAGADQKSTKDAVQSLAKQKFVYFISYEFVISPENLSRAHRVLSDIWNTKRNIAPTDFRETLGTTRKYAMALLQHFDDNRITRRLNEGRVLLKAPEN